MPAAACAGVMHAAACTGMGGSRGPSASHQASCFSVNAHSLAPQVGGPLVPDLDTALVKYPHKAVVLEGGIKQNIAVWLAQQHVDVLVIPGEEWCRCRGS